MKTKNHVFFDYFSYLSYRGNENSLSDIIAAACNSCSKFKNLFLEFFFPKEGLMNKCPSDIEREVCSEDETLRFDWYFTTNDEKEYIIENKIYDRNDHFTAYTQVYNEKQIGFIANYDISQIQYSHKHTWKNFYGYIKKNLKLFTGEELLLIESILNYIKGACDFMEERKFDLKKLKDLGYFINLLKEILKDKGFEINNKAKGSTDERIGFWTYKNNRSYWFGLYLHDEGNAGYSFWGAIFDYEIKQKNFNNLKLADYHEEDKSENCRWFKLKIAQLNKVSEDISIVRDFIDEVENIK